MPGTDVGAELARESAGSVDAGVGCYDAIASKLCSYGFVVDVDVVPGTDALWELSLLAKALGQLMQVLAVTTPSRASFVPTDLRWMDVVTGTDPL
ncbi:hypothetical protein [Pseudomonas sp. SJZ131]|uniref:hypothetical protein n=1 Tax=Pseudomonas sp. SJZ131 TaxID=2572895 RepID=UPI0011A48904|nr:hypothetical protein [Pseudomonas sp. SJZ131]